MDDAERLYYAAISTRLVKRAFCAEAAHLEADSPGAGEYLRWLMVRGHAWPRVATGPKPPTDGEPTPQRGCATPLVD